MPERKKILITGASGNLGSKIRRHLEARNQYDLILIDIDPRGDASIIPVDLSSYSETWARLFENVDVIVHMAADPRQNAPWESLEGKNIDSVINVYQAAINKRVKRVVFASSIAVMRGYLGTKITITPTLPIRPVNFYGATKAMGERLGKSYAEHHGLSVICLRIGWVQPGENRPSAHMGKFCDQSAWLSNRDLCQAVEQAITVADIKFSALSVTSNNLNMPWDISETRRVLGFVPQDGHIPDTMHLKAFLWHIKRRLLDLISWRKSLL